MNKKHTFLTLVSAVVATGLVLGCDNSNNGSERDFLQSSGSVMQSDGKTPAANLPITNYSWVTTFSDGSTVSNDVTPMAGLTTDAAGGFAVNSSQLNLRSGIQKHGCSEVCVDWQIGSEDICTDWQNETQDYCADWATDDCGNDYCADWQTESSDYCANWDTQSYSYCGVYQKDCGWIYPNRSLSDVTSAYSEITYNDGTSLVTTQSQSVTKPSGTINNTTTSNSSINTNWIEHDLFITAIGASSTMAASLNTTPSTAQSTEEKRAQITALRNASKIAARKMRRSGTPQFGRTYKTPLRFEASQIDSLTSAQRATLDNTRASWGATPNL